VPSRLGARRQSDASEHQSRLLHRPSKALPTLPGTREPVDGQAQHPAANRLPVRQRASQAGTQSVSARKCNRGCCAAIAGAAKGTGSPELLANGPQSAPRMIPRVIDVDLPGVWNDKCSARRGMRRTTVQVVLSTEEFELFRQLLWRESGLYVGAGRQEFFRLAVVDRVAALAASSFREYYEFITSCPEGQREIQSLIDAVTVGETYFFRNERQFDWLRMRLLPQLVQQRPSGSKVLNVWSAGCATGEEPYSLAIALLESLPFPENWQISILASDVNQKFLEQAAEGVYGSRAVRLVPPAWLNKYFRRQDGNWHVKDELKRIVRFTYHNLSADPFTLPGMQDLEILFCRNVMIYFPLPTATAIVSQLADCVNTGGRLFLGDTETLWQISDRFTPEPFSRAVVYRKGVDRPGADTAPFILFQESIGQPTAASVAQPLRKQRPQVPARALGAPESGGWLATPGGCSDWPGASAAPGC
jgi:chemotaxis protein methyltransferase CheR